MNPKNEDASRHQIRRLTTATTLTITINSQLVCNISQ